MNPQQPSSGESTREDRATHWLSQGFETLVASLEGDPDRTTESIDFDVVVVGTGYGGSVAAAELAKTRGNRRICVLERGREHLPGSFPSRMADLAGHVRFSTQRSRHPRGRREGLFDVRIGEDLCALVGNGVGGGSLINAGVMALPDQDVFESPKWPGIFHQGATVEALFKLAAGLRQRLGATQTVKSPTGQPEPLKYTALGRFQGAAKVEPLPITVALTNAADNAFQTPAGVGIDACIRCGDCATGCNHNAKISLDVTLLAEARQHGAELFAGATVLKIEKLVDLGPTPVWQLHVVHTDEPLRRRHGKPTLIRAHRVVLAAGTFGSTEILLRSQGTNLRLSPRLGCQVSSNGDLIAAAYGGKARANCVGDEDKDPRFIPAADQVGPTITGMVDLRKTGGMIIQDLGVPGPLRSVLEQSVTMSSAIHMLTRSDRERHDARTHDACAVDAQAIDNTLLVAIIGHDSADGVLKLNSSDAWDSGDGAATVEWPALKDYPPLLERHRRFEKLLADSGTGARALPNPMWRLLPENLDDVLSAETGPLLTVHPLGGCPMGDDAAAGVVDDCGRVFDASPGATGPHEGLVVLDGAIVPTSLGMNPALTIASLALRAIGRLRTEWGYVADGTRIDIGNRPYFKRPGTVEPPQDTLIEVLERLSGSVAIEGMEQSGEDGRRVPHVELTMRFDPVSIKHLTSGTDAATLRLQPAHGLLRIFPHRPPDDTEAEDECAVLIATVKGTLRAFSHQESLPIERRLRSLWAWFRNRGLRDTVLWVIDRFKGEGQAPTDKGFFQEAIGRSKRLWQLSSRAGAVRLLEYDLTIDSILASKVSADVEEAFRGGVIQGEKQLTYSRRANPWRQLMAVSLKAFPGTRKAGAVLTLDTGYLARQRVPLFRVVQQQDQPAALADIVSLGLYLARILIHIHLWSFRLPDAPQPRYIQRLPGFVPGLPAPEIRKFQVARSRNGMPVMVRLTHYPYCETRRARALQAAPAAREAVETPILLIHGYSASGTTFAHHAVQPNVATGLWNRGRDVWIVDMRTSAGMPHARWPWSFEQVGMTDIPLAVYQVCVLTGAEKIDVFAHCMGSAMLNMALLGSQSSKERFPQLRQELPQRIRRLVMSQVAPAVIFTPANVFRAYAMQYLKHFLPIRDYEFRPTGKRAQTDQMIDRLLATLPYPEDEFDRENPFWPPWRRTPWVGTRHRMDALYGRDFNVNNLPSKVLDYIDDHFGPLNIDTVSQAIHFARLRTITNRHGFNDYVRPDRLRDKLRFPIFHVHGMQNGLISRRTPQHFQKVLTDCDSRFKSDEAFLPRLYNAGHQDLLIGSPAPLMLKELNAYLEEPFSAVTGAQPEINITFAARIPPYGVRVPPPFAGSERCSLGDDGASGDPVAVLLIPVVLQAGQYLPTDETGQVVEPKPDYLASNIEWRPIEPVSPRAEATRFTFELAGYAPPAGTCGFLTLLLYNQSAEIAAPPIGTSRSFCDLAMSVALKAKSGKGLKRLAGLVADPKGVTLGGMGMNEFIDKLVQAMAVAVERVFKRVGNAELALGILCPPPRHNSSAPTPAVRSFAVASCQYPGGIVDRTPHGTPRESPAGPSDASYLRLLSVLEGKRADGGPGVPPLPVPEFLVLMGDQVYVDATAGLFDARLLADRHRISYEAFFGARGPRLVLSRLPAVMRLDDHEIGDNWEPDPPGSNPREWPDTRHLRDRGVAEYLRNQCDEEPPDSSEPIQLWHQKPLAGFQFFWADARTRRAPRTAATVGSASLLDQDQSKALDQWLADKNVEGPRFLVSAPMVLPRHLEMWRASVATAVRSDAWEGYPASLHRLLAGIYERGTSDVVLLSGNEHISNVASIQISKLGVPGAVLAHSIHSSALYAPYPFANGSEGDFAGTEEFEFSNEGVMYRCKVNTWHPSRGDGFAVLSISADEAGWLVAVRFDREKHSPADPVDSTEFRISRPT